MLPPLSLPLINKVLGIVLRKVPPTERAGGKERGQGGEKRGRRKRGKGRRKGRKEGEREGEKEERSFT